MHNVRQYLDIIKLLLEIKNRNTNLHLTQSCRFVDCGKSITEEEINEEECVDDPITIHQDIEKSNICEDIKKEVKEVESVDDLLYIINLYYVKIFR